MSASGLLTIGQLADYVGVTVRAVRHYHQRGLLEEPARDASGYRRYDVDAVLRLIRIKVLAEAGVPLARIDELLDAGPEELAASVERIDAALQEQIRELERRRRRIADLAGGERVFLPPELAGFVDEMRAAGLGADVVRYERDAWILLIASHPEQALEWLAHKRADFADPEYQELYRRYGEALAWEPDEPRVEALAEDIAAFIERRYGAWPEPPDLGIDDPTVVALLNAQYEVGASPAVERLRELANEKLTRRGLGAWRLGPPE